MSDRSEVLLVNPPLWNAYSPHLAVPLLLGVLRTTGRAARAVDLSIETADFLLSSEGLALLADRIAGRASSADPVVARRARRADLLLEATLEQVDEAKAALRSEAALCDPVLLRTADTILRNAMWCVSAAFDDLRFDLVANDLYYSARSTQAVLDAAVDPERNVYRWAFEHMGVADGMARPSDIVGLSVSSDTQLVAAMTYARMVKERSRDSVVVMGGNFTTRMVERWKEVHPFFDLVDAFVLYEGEESLPMLCDAADAGAPLDVPGIVRPEGGTLLRREARNVDLGGVAAGDFDDFPLGKYFAPGPVLPTYASRSCAWECAFCSIPFASNKFRARSAELVVDEMERLGQRYGTRYFYFVDEILTLRSVREMSAELVRRDLDLYWYAETRFSAAWTPEVARLAYDAGCRRLSLGLESYNQGVLDRMKKGTKIEWMAPNIDALLGAGIPLHLFCIVGFPGESHEEAMRTVAFATDACGRSREVYGVAHTTWAAAPFVLDLHSPIGTDPAAFGVAVIPPPVEEDLALTAEYTTQSGMTAAESWAVTQEIERSVHDDLGRIDDDDDFWFEIPARRHIDERLFVAACRGFDDLRTGDEETRVWLPPVEPTRLGKHVVTHVAEDAGDVGRLTLYDPHADAVHVFHGAAASALAILHEPGLLGAKAEALGKHGGWTTGNDALDVLAALARTGMLVAADAAWTTWDGSPVVVEREPATRGRFDAARGVGFLRNVATGTVVRTGAVGYGWTLLAREGTPSDGRRVTDLAAQVGVGPDAVRAQLETLVRQRILYLVRPGDRRWREAVR